MQFQLSCCLVSNNFLAKLLIQYLVHCRFSINVTKLFLSPFLSPFLQASCDPKRVYPERAITKESYPKLAFEQQEHLDFEGGEQKHLLVSDM